MLSVEAALCERRSVREFADEPLSLAQLGQLMWAAQGLTSAEGLRAAPSAGATYPLELYVVAGKVEGLDAGVFKYRPADHALAQTMAGDQRLALGKAALDQACVRYAPIGLVITALRERTALKYHNRADRYIHMEAGHAAQNIYLQAIPLGLGTVAVGAFDDDAVSRTLGLTANEQPMYIMPIGKTLSLGLQSAQTR
jgi:SagB-type dehydrogenase family enzyme